MDSAIKNKALSPAPKNPVWEAGLSLVSTQGLWILFQRELDQSPKLKDCLVWTDSQTSRISGLAGSKLSEILNKNHLGPKNLSCLWGVTGPGTFTGIRVTGSLLLGLGKALSIPTYGISTFSLRGEPVGIPLQSLRQKGLSQKEIFESQTHVIFLKTESEVEIRPLKSGEVFWGGAEKPDWPSAGEFINAVQKAGDKHNPFKPDYGYNPEFKKVSLLP